MHGAWCSQLHAFIPSAVAFLAFSCNCDCSSLVPWHSHACPTPTPEITSCLPHRALSLAQSHPPCTPQRLPAQTWRCRRRRSRAALAPPSCVCQCLQSVAAALGCLGLRQQQYGQPEPGSSHCSARQQPRLLHSAGQQRVRQQLGLPAVPAPEPLHLPCSGSNRRVLLHSWYHRCVPGDPSCGHTAGVQLAFHKARQAPQVLPCKAALACRA